MELKYDLKKNYEMAQTLIDDDDNDNDNDTGTKGLKSGKSTWNEKDAAAFGFESI